MKSMMIMKIVFVFQLWMLISIEAKSTPKPHHHKTTPRKDVCPVSPFARDVFLGGSCNPTTWRADIAIPTFQDLGISYYNPQVADWSPDLIIQEHEAKRHARILLFVISYHTRNTASMMEAAQLAISRRESLVVVIDSFREGQQIFGETITSREFEALRNGLWVVQYFMDRQRIPMYDNVRNAINAIQRVLRDGNDVQVLYSEDDVRISESNDDEVVDIIFLRQAFNSIVTNLSPTVGLSDALRVLQSSQGINPPPRCDQRGQSSTNEQLNFEEFCSLARQYLMSTSLQQFGERDLYIGVEGVDHDWIRTTAEPLLRASSLTLHEGESYTYGLRLLPRELELITSSRIILLVIGQTSRALGISALAAQLVGLGATNLVLCIPMMPESVVIDGEQLTPRAIADYNRGRSYLESFAQTEGISVFRTTRAALEHAIKLAKRFKRTFSFVPDLFLRD